MIGPVVFILVLFVAAFLGLALRETFYRVPPLPKKTGISAPKTRIKTSLPLCVPSLSVDRLPVTDTTTRSMIRAPAPISESQLDALVSPFPVTVNMETWLPGDDPYEQARVQFIAQLIASQRRYSNYGPPNYSCLPIFLNPTTDKEKWANYVLHAIDPMTPRLEGAVPDSVVGLDVEGTWVAESDHLPAGIRDPEHYFLRDDPQLCAGATTNMTDVSTPLFYYPDEVADATRMLKTRIELGCSEADYYRRPQTIALLNSGLVALLRTLNCVDRIPERIRLTDGRMMYLAIDELDERASVEIQPYSKTGDLESPDAFWPEG